MICREHQHGLTLVEVLVSLVLISIALVPAISALQTGALGTSVHGDVLANHVRLASRLEELLAEPFMDLATAATNAGGPTVISSYSDAAGLPARRLVYVAFYDGDDVDADADPFTGPDADILWISVELEGTVHAIQTITARGY